MTLQAELVLQRYGQTVERPHDFPVFLKVRVQLYSAFQRIFDPNFRETVCLLK